MNKVILIGCLIMAVSTSFAQTSTIDVKTARVKDSIRIGPTNWINGVSGDTTLSVNARNIVYAGAIKAYVNNRLGVTASNNYLTGGSFTNGNIKLPRFGLDTVVISIDGRYLKISDTANLWPTVQRFLDSIAAVKAKVQANVTLQQAIQNSSIATSVPYFKGGGWFKTGLQIVNTNENRTLNLRYN